MNVQLPVHMDQQDFLAWVQGREERYELDRGRVIMMTGGSRAHWQITANLLKALTARLDPERFAVLPEFGVALGPTFGTLSRRRRRYGRRSFRRCDGNRSRADC